MEKLNEQAYTNNFIVFDDDLPVMGTKYHISEINQVKKHNNIKLEFEVDKDNHSDPNAIKIIAIINGIFNNRKYNLGYVPKSVAKSLQNSNLYRYTKPILKSISGYSSHMDENCFGFFNVYFQIIGPENLFFLYNTNYSELEFYLESINESIVSILEVGDKITLWMKRDQSGVIAYTNKNGLAGGMGRVGYVPRFLEKKFIEHFTSGGDFEASVINLQTSSCEIKAVKLSKEWVLQKQEERLQNFHNQVKSQINLPYKPKTSFDLRIHIELYGKEIKKKYRKGNKL